MRKRFVAAAVLTLVAAVATSPLWAKTHSFKLHRDGSINGVHLKAGSYQLELNGKGEALIYQRGQPVARARVEVKSLPPGEAGSSVLEGPDGTLREIRLKERVVVFVR